MAIKIIEKTKEKLVFVTEINESLANAVRRSVNEIPILAIEDVEIYKNDSVLYDEIVAHRLGLIPLKTEKELNLKENCNCEGKGCAKCTVQLKLAKSGEGYVYSGELQGKAEVVYDNIPITLLRENQEIELVANAVLGNGIKHAKYSPGLAYYRNLAEVKIEGELSKEGADSCPLHLLRAGKKGEIENVWKCDLCEACVEACKKEGKNNLSVKESKEIVFFIESWGQIDAKEMVIQAVDALKDNLKIVEKA